MSACDMLLFSEVVESESNDNAVIQLNEVLLFVKSMIDLYKGFVTKFGIVRTFWQKQSEEA